MTELSMRSDAELRPDPARVVARLFLPGEEALQGRSRASAVVARVLALAESEVAVLAEQIVAEFSPRHRNFVQTLARHCEIVSSHVPYPAQISEARSRLLGASFTAEYAIEAAALCNPSAVLHPDQTGLEPGQARLAVSLRGIGEGHVSCIGFCTAVVGPGPLWRFEPRDLPAVSGLSGHATWQREHLRAVLADQGEIAELAYSLLAGLPPQFTSSDLQRAIDDEHQALTARPGGRQTVDLLRRLVTSAYEVEFPADVSLSQQVLLPSAPEESNGVEDARFVRFVDDRGDIEYRGTYTAYDGEKISPRVLISRDLKVFRAHRLAGRAARNKGMALFPRLIDRQHWALCRSDGESTFLASSADGYAWGTPVRIQVPEASWEVLQVGNCGPPIETEAGWLVLTHGVGPMRRYSMGAILLKLTDPSVVLARLDRPLLTPDHNEQDGYVPNVVYSCGAVVHDGRLWIPYGISDARIGVVSAELAELLAEMVPTDR